MDSWLKWAAGIVVALGILSGAVWTIFGEVSQAKQSHDWTLANEAPVEAVLVQSQINAEAVELLRKDLAERTRLEREREQRRQAREERDRELCALGAKFPDEPNFCERRGFERDDGE